MLALCYNCPPWRFVVDRALGGLWKGVFLSPLGTTRLRELSPPPLPSGWALVRVLRCGLCASDVHLIRLQLSPTIAPAAMVDGSGGPVVLGHELVGVIEAAGQDCPLPVGTRVISRSGGFRNCFNLGAQPCTQCLRGEYAMCQRQGQPPPAHEPVRGGGFAELYWEHAANLLPVPPAVSDDLAMLAEPLACSLRAVLKLPPAAGQRVLVIGAGIQGLGAVHWLGHVRPGNEVTCLVRHDYQARLARTLGAQFVFQGRLSGAELAKHLHTPCARGIGGNELLLEGFDAIVDSVGAPATVNAALRWIRPGGSLIILGAHLYGGKLDYTPVWFRDVRVSGAFAHGLEQYEGRSIQTLDLAMQLSAGPAALPVSLLTHRVALRDFGQALKLYDARGTAQTVRVAVTSAG